MASLSLSILGCCLPLFAQDAPAPAPPAQPAPPWVVVDSPDEDPRGDLDDLDLVVLSNGTYVGAYQLWGEELEFVTTHVVRSRDHGATWERLGRLEHLRDVSLIEHDDVVWLLGIEADSLSPGSPAVMCLRDADKALGGCLSRVRMSQPMQAEGEALVHEGRVWRAFSQDLPDENVWDMRRRFCVASAPLGSDLQSEASWRWSSEVASDGPVWALLTAIPADGLSLALVDGRTLGVLANIRNEGRDLSRHRELPAWNLLPGEPWRSNFVRDPVGGRSYLLSGDSTRATQPGDRPRNVLVLRSTKLLLLWEQVPLLHDADELPAAFGAGALLVEGDDLAALFSFHVASKERDAPPSLRVAFLRIPGFRERTGTSAPLWGPPLSR
jgi:hypothetical protein